MTNRGLQDVKNMALAQNRGQRGETSCGCSSTTGRETTVSCPRACVWGGSAGPPLGCQHPVLAAVLLPA